MSNSFLPAKLNFPIWPTATFRYAFQWLDEVVEEEKAKRTPKDLTGFGGLAVLRGDDGTVFELVSAAGTEAEREEWYKKFEKHEITEEELDTKLFPSSTKGRIFFRSTLKSNEERKEGFVQMYIETRHAEKFEWKKATYELLVKEGSIPKEAPEPDTFPLLTGVFTVSRAGAVV